MKRTLMVVFALLLATQASATYIVVLKDGTQYKAKEKWTVSAGKARVNLENGQMLTLDPSLIDEKKSEQFTKAGVSNAKIINLETNLPSAAPPPEQRPSLGSSIKLRTGAPAPKAEVKPAEPPVKAGPMISTQVLDKFELAYENVGIFEHTLKPTGPASLRADLTVDNEAKVFNAVTATSFLMMRNAGIPGAQIEAVELFMKMTNGGAAGRFHMTREDAQALDQKTISVQDYFVRKVLY